MSWDFAGDILLQKQVIPTVSASPDYSIGDCIGGIQTISDVGAEDGRALRLVSLTVKDKAGQAPQFTIYLFKAAPASGTYTDNSALVWGAGDAANLVGCVKLVTANYQTVGGVSVAALGEIGQIVAMAADDCFAILAADAAWNAASTSDLQLEFGFKRE